MKRPVKVMSNIVWSACSRSFTWISGRIEESIRQARKGVSDTQMRLYRIAAHTVFECCDPEQDPGHVNEDMSQQAQKRMSARPVSTRREMGQLASWEELRKRECLPVQ